MFEILTQPHILLLLLVLALGAVAVTWTCWRE